MPKLISIITSVLKTSARILTIGIVLNLGRLIFLALRGHNYIARPWILAGIIICIVAPRVYIITLKVNLIPMASNALFQSYKNDIDGLSQQLSTQLINMHHHIDGALDQIPNKGKRLIKQVSSHLLDMDTEAIFDSLDTQEPQAQLDELKTKLHDTIQQKIQTGPGGWTIVIINIVILGGLFVVGILI